MFVFVPIIPHVSHYSYACVGPYCWIYTLFEIACLLIFMSILCSFMKK